MPDESNHAARPAWPPTCDRCKAPLREPGGLFFSPPGDDGRTRKCHLCVGCTAAVIDDICAGPVERPTPDPGHPHLIRGEFQSDKYPTCPRGQVPLSTKDPTAQDLLWEYAQRRRAVDAEFSVDLERALRNAGYTPPVDGAA